MRALRHPLRPQPPARRRPVVPPNGTLVPVNVSQALLIGLAAASLFKLVAVDRITQWLRHKVIGGLANAGGWLPYHLQYLLGCALCLPMWGAAIMYSFRDDKWCIWITMVLAARIVAFSLLRWLQDANVRDWPEGIKFPPEREGKG